jgi:hypothetical protein
MKIVQVYLTDDFLKENTTRLSFRNLSPKDYLVASGQLAGGLLIAALGGYGLGKMQMQPGLDATSAGFRIMRSVGNGVTHIGSDRGGEFHLDFIDSEEQANLREKYAKTPLDINTPIYPFYLVTDDDEADKAQISKGALFYNESEAHIFAESYDSLSTFLRNKPDQLLSIRVPEETAMTTFEEELGAFLKKYNSSLLVTETYLKQPLNERHFLLTEISSSESHDSIYLGPDEKPVIEITFPKEINSSDLERFFPRTLNASRALDIELRNRVEEQKQRLEVKEDLSDIEETYLEEREEVPEQGTAKAVVEYGQEKEAEVRLRDFLADNALQPKASGDFRGKSVHDVYKRGFFGHSPEEGEGKPSPEGPKPRRPGSS